MMAPEVQMYYGYGPGRDGFGWDHAWLGGIFMMLFCLLVIIAVVALARAIWRRGEQQPMAMGHTHDLPGLQMSGRSAREVLDLLLASGRIDDAEYRKRRTLLDTEKFEG